MGHGVERIGHADPNPPAEGLDRPKLAEWKLNFQSHWFDLAQRLRSTKTSYHGGP
jgi:hypothetical protein